MTPRQTIAEMEDLLLRYKETCEKGLEKCKRLAARIAELENLVIELADTSNAVCDLAKAKTEQGPPGLLHPTLYALRMRELETIERAREAIAKARGEG